MGQEKGMKYAIACLLAAGLSLFFIFLFVAVYR
jgi:hypothetical protein